MYHMSNSHKQNLHSVTNLLFLFSHGNYCTHEIRLINHGQIRHGVFIEIKARDTQRDP